MNELPELTTQEKKILLALSFGNLNKEIAADCEISIEMVKKQLKNIYQKLEVQKRSDAVAKFLDVSAKVTRESFALMQ